VLNPSYEVVYLGERPVAPLTFSLQFQGLSEGMAGIITYPSDVVESLGEARLGLEKLAAEVMRVQVGLISDEQEPIQPVEILHRGGCFTRMTLVVMFGVRFVADFNRGGD
jgi:hypothetical protein